MTSSKILLGLCLFLIPFSVWAQPSTFINPILPGAYPDPSICRVGEEYYIVNSSFEYFPGLPIHKSDDLVNWELIGYGLHRAGQCTGTNNLVDVQSNGGIHAPTIRYNNGTFYIITTNIYTPPEDGRETQFINFIITAKKPEGPWSDPHIIQGAPGIDPDLFFDDDGKVYFVGTHQAGDKNANGIGEIWVQELNLDNWSLMGERTTIWGGACGGCCVEGPHMYKKEGKYYIMVAEGGTSFNHAVMIAASDNITGPFESSPRNPILTSRHLSKDNWVHSTGHADLVELADGRWYMVALGIRGDEERGSNMGRETHLIPVTWEGSTVRWEEVSEGEWAPVEFMYPVGAPETGKVEKINPLPFKRKPQYSNDAFADNFDGESLGLQWNFRRVPLPNTYSLTDKSGSLRLFLHPNVITNRERASLIGFRQRESDFQYEASMSYQPKRANEEAGISMFQKDDNFINYTISKNEQGLYLKLTISEKTKAPYVVKSISIPQFRGDIIFKVTSMDDQYVYEYSLNNGNSFNKFATTASTIILNNGYTGAFFGVYATSNGNKTKAYADFDWVKYKGYPR